MTFSFSSWVHRQHGRGTLMPQADRVVPLVASAGITGMTRKELGHAINLDRDVLDQLLTGLVQAGQLSLTWEDEIPVYRTSSGFNMRPGLTS